jgi:glycerophosphoryl diester phosphodiesterase
MSKLGWLTARPIAHRGLHDISAGIVENTASAFHAAIAGNYGIETDLQISADGDAMVHHDDALGRLTEGSERLEVLSAAQIGAARFKIGSDRILTLGELLDLVGGRVPLLLELKSRFDGNRALAKRVADVLAGYRGPVAAMSFDPDLVEALTVIAPAVTRGITAERDYEWLPASAARRARLAYFLHAPSSRPQFIAYGARDLPSFAPWLASRVFGLPILTWTVRSEAERTRVSGYADQIIFEGFLPSAK